MSAFFHPPPVPHPRSVRFLLGTSSALAVLLLGGGLWLAHANLRGTEASEALGEQVRAAQFASETLLSTLKDAETGQRGYLLTGDPSYLQPYDAARARLDADFAQLERTPAANPLRRQQRIGRMRALAASKLAELGETVALRQSGQDGAALDLVRTNRGKQAMDALRAEVDALQANGAAELAQAQTRGRAAWGWAAPMGLGALASLLLGAAAWEQRRVRRVIAARLARLERFTCAFGLAQGMLRDLDGRITFWNGGTERLYGYTPDEALGRVSHELLHTGFPRPLPEIEAMLLRDGQWQGELTHRRRDGTVIAVSSQWALHRGAAGEVDAVIEVNTDVSALRQAEREREQSAALLRAVVETAPGLIYAKDREGRMVLANPPVMDLIGKPWSAVEGHTDREFLDDKVQAEAVMANDRRVMEAGESESLEEMVGGEGPRSRVWLSTKRPLRGADGQVIGLVGVSVEITERKRIEDRLRLVIDELNHRVKNTLTTVQSIASQTLRGVDPLVRQKLEARLLALASAHDVLTAARWEGADLHDVVAGVLSPHGGVGDGRFQVAGPPLRLVPGAAVAIAMGLHELATNALKYGALSGKAGHAAIRWEITGGDQPQLRLAWSEAGGPPVTVPAQRGFGTRLIERSLAQDLGGTARIAFAPEGVTCVIEAPLDGVAAPAEVLPFPRIGVLGSSAR